MSCFSGDPNFCPECGNVLPLPGMKDAVCCPRCSFSISVSGTAVAIIFDNHNSLDCNYCALCVSVFCCLEFSGREIRSTVVFNPLDKSSVDLEGSDNSEMKGPVVR